MWLFDNERVPDIRTDLPGPIARKLLARDDVFVSPSYTRIYPLVCDRGSGAVIRDVDGNLFLDFTAGIAVCTTGHCHPDVVESIRDQAGKLIHMSGTDFYYRPQIELAEALAQLAPGASTKKVFFCNSGAEAVEAGLKLARHHTHRNRVVAFFGAFHGRTYGAMSLSGSKLVHRRSFSPLVPDIHHVEYPRGNVDAMQELKILFHRTAPPDEVAAIFIEPIQGEGGYHPAPPEFLRDLRELCDRHGILMVVDEVQSGMGRTGKMFAIEHAGVEPDIICLAKGIASGLPLGAIISKGDIMDWPPGSHASTFGGNPVACRAALTTIELLKSEYMANAEARGHQLRNGLRDLADDHDCLAHVRGLGLMTAVDVVNEQGEHDAKSRDAIIQTAFERGLLLLGCGESALRFCPPLCVTDEQVVTCLKLLGQVVADVYEDVAS